MTTARWLGPLCGAMLVAALAATGCPPRAQAIRISADGIDALVESCVPCPNKSCAAGTCCTISGGPLPKPNGAGDGGGGGDAPDNVAAQFVLLERSQAVTALDPSSVRAIGPCMALSLDCFELMGTSDMAVAKCLALAVNDVIAREMPGGIGFDDLEDPADALLVLTLHNDPGAATTACTSDTLFACAGLEANLDDEQDIVCGSCRDGCPKASSENQNDPPCIGSCFVDGCRMLLVATGG